MKLYRKLGFRETHELLDKDFELSSLAPCHCNDMAVDRAGRAWVGNFGFDRHRGDEPRTTVLVRVDPEGAATVVADGLAFPNGTVLCDDGDTLVVAETRAARLTAFRIGADGSLTARRIWADLGDRVPDGICLDAEGAIWVADPRHGEVLRVLEGGEIDRRLSIPKRGAYACVLGGDDGRTLFVCTNTTSGPEAASRGDGRIEAFRVDVPSGGSP